MCLDCVEASKRRGRRAVFRACAGVFLRVGDILFVQSFSSLIGLQMLDRRGFGNSLDARVSVPHMEIYATE